MRALRLLLLPLLILSMSPAQAFADATAFFGVTTSPSRRPARGVAIGVSLLVVGFEFEYSSTGEDEEEGAPGLRTGMGNVLLQTPSLGGGVQLYLTAGGGLYRERLDTEQTTHVGINSGGGAKLPLLGPLRVRVDYRAFRLSGEPLHSTVHRVYAGANLAF
jgi:hypothetical protein